MPTGTTVGFSLASAFRLEPERVNPIARLRLRVAGLPVCRRHAVSDPGPRFRIPLVSQSDTNP